MIIGALEYVWLFGANRPRRDHDVCSVFDEIRGTYFITEFQ